MYILDAGDDRDLKFIRVDMFLITSNTKQLKKQRSSALKQPGQVPSSLEM